MYLKITVIEKNPNCSENDIFIINIFLLQCWSIIPPVRTKRITENKKDYD